MMIAGMTGDFRLLTGLFASVPTLEQGLQTTGSEDICATMRYQARKTKRYPIDRLMGEDQEES